MPLLEINRRALVFSMAMAMGSALLFGLGPAIQTTRVNLVTALKTSDIDTTTAAAPDADGICWWPCRSRCPSSS